MGYRYGPEPEPDVVNEGTKGKTIQQLVQNGDDDSVRIKFKKGTTEFLNAEQEQEFEFLMWDQMHLVKEVTINGYASSDGEEKFNLELSKKRAKKIEELIRKKFPNLKINIKAWGEVEGDYEKNRAVVIDLDYISLVEVPENEAVVAPHVPEHPSNIIPGVTRTREELERIAESLPLRTLNQGYGQTNDQSFTITVEISYQQFLQVRDQYARDPSFFNNNDWASYYPLGERFNRGEPLAVGDEMFINIQGPLNGFVRFTGIDLEDESFSIRATTLDGYWFSNNHPDAGNVEFRGEFDRNNNNDGKGWATFEIHNTTKLGTWMSNGAGPSSCGLNFARFAQKEQWVEVINNIEDFLGTSGEKWMLVQFLNEKGEEESYQSYHW